MVLAGFVTAWRFASWPTRRSPVFVKATTDGTVRPPSADAMTVGSPPSMAATTEFVVPRSMPMILPIACSSPGVEGGVGVVRWSVQPRASVADGNEGRAQHAVPKAVAAPDLQHDLALRGAAPGDVTQRLVLIWVEGQPEGLDRGHALALEERPELAVDRDDPLEPRVVARLWREVLEGEVEVVGQLHDPREQGLAGAVEVALPVGLRPALEVRVVGRGPLGRHKVLVGLRERRSAFGGQRLDLGEERRRSRLELRDPVVGSRPAVRRGLVRMVRHAASPSFRSRGGPRDRSSGWTRSAPSRS